MIKERVPGIEVAAKFDEQHRITIPLPLGEPSGHQRQGKKAYFDYDSWWFPLSWNFIYFI